MPERPNFPWWPLPVSMGLPLPPGEVTRPLAPIAVRAGFDC